LMVQQILHQRSLQCSAGISQLSAIFSCFVASLMILFLQHVILVVVQQHDQMVPSGTPYQYIPDHYSVEPQ
jgi:hypothetical protein